MDSLLIPLAGIGLGLLLILCVVGFIVLLGKVCDS